MKYFHSKDFTHSFEQLHTTFIPLMPKCLCWKYSTLNQSNFSNFHITLVFCNITRNNFTFLTIVQLVWHKRYLPKVSRISVIKTNLLGQNWITVVSERSFEHQKEGKEKQEQKHFQRTTQVRVFTPDRLKQMNIYRWKEPTQTIQQKAEELLTSWYSWYFLGYYSCPAELDIDLVFLYVR